MIYLFKIYLNISILQIPANSKTEKGEVRSIWEKGVRLAEDTWINKHENISDGVLWMMSLFLVEVCQCDWVTHRMCDGGGDWRHCEEGVIFDCQVHFCMPLYISLYGATTARMVYWNFKQTSQKWWSRLSNI
jgi:hypothetical protein